MADTYADFDNDKKLAHDTAARIKARRHPVQHSPITSKQQEEIIRAVRGTGIDAKEQFLAVVPSAADRRIDRLSELMDVEHFKVVSALAYRKRHCKSHQSAPLLFCRRGHGHSIGNRGLSSERQWHR